MPLLLGQVRGPLGQALDLQLVELLDLAVAAGDELPDVAHPRPLAEDDVVAGQGDQRGDAQRRGRR